MELGAMAGLIMTAAVELSGLPLEENMQPKFVVMSQQELVSDLCVKGKEYQCADYKSFSPPMSNKIILSKDLDPSNIFDQGIIFHETLKYLLFANTKVSPIDSCEKVWGMEAKIYNMQMRFIANQMANGGSGYSADEIINGNKGTFVTWCDPTKKHKNKTPQPKVIEPTI